MRHLKKTLTLLLVSTLALTGCFNHQQNTYQGYIEGDLTYVASQVSGTLVKLNVLRGTKVTKNQPLFNLEFQPESDAVAQAQASLIEAKANLANLEKGERPSELAAIKAQQYQILAQLKLAKVTMERYRKLYKKQFIEKQSLDQAISNYNDLRAKLAEVSQNLTTAKLAARSDEIIAAKARVLEATAQLNQLKWQFNQKTINSPISGIVFDRYYRTGEVVPADHPVVSVLENKNIYLVSFLPEKMLSTIKLGQTIQFTCDGCKKTMTATISFISPEAEFTPPIIYSEKTTEKLIYRIEASLTPAETDIMHPGQPITIVFPT